MDGKIKTFREVFDWITYDLDHNYTLNKNEKKNHFYVNKLCIKPNELSYKTEIYELEKGLFEKVEILYNLLNDQTQTKIYKNLNK